MKYQAGESTSASPTAMNGTPNSMKGPGPFDAAEVQKSANARNGMPNRNVIQPLRMAKYVASGRPDHNSRSPASSSDDSLVMHRRLAPVRHALVLDVAEVLIEHDAVLARQRDEPFS